MASGYTAQSATVGSFTVRFYWTSSYTASDNTSTITVTPRVYNTGYYGGDLWACGYNLSNPGIYLGGSNPSNIVYAFDAAWGTGHNLKCPANQNSWTSFPPYTGSINTITISHDANGVASTKVRFLGTIVPMNFESYKQSIDSGELSISFTQPAPYAITYKANSGSGAPSKQDVYARCTYNLSSQKPTRTGYTFKGWATSSTATTATYQPGQSVTPNGNLTLWAVWQINTWAVDYDANGGSGAPASQTKTYGQTLVLAADVPVRTGYTFKGWATTSDASVAQYQPGGNYTANEAATLYAVWEVTKYKLDSSQISSRGITATVRRLTSPYQGALTENLSDGADIYYGDTIKVSWTVTGGYQIDTDNFTINGEDVSSLSPPEKTITVDQNLVVVLLVELGAVVYITNQMYQVFIWSGSAWEQYEAYIYNGASWDAY